MTIARKKLIEVALPLEAINKASAREKSIRHGHPSTLHLWWARRPLAAARAVIFSQMVDDPSTYIDVLKSDQALLRRAESELKARLAVWGKARSKAETSAAAGETVVDAGLAPTLDLVIADLERKRLFAIIEDLVLWENTTNETVLTAARDEIWASWRRACVDNVDHPRAKEIFNRNFLPAFHDPFAGGGALPLEAQRLGLESHASDLNPVAVLINKAMIEIPPKFAGNAPVNPTWQKKSDGEKASTVWKGAHGLADDVRFYGQWMRDEAERRIGHLYPKIEITREMASERPDLDPYVGQKLTVIAWLWARTVKSPNPAFALVDVPLASTFMLSTKPGKEAYVEPVIENGGFRFTVKVGKPTDAEAAMAGTKLARANFRCVMSETPISGDYIKSEGMAHRMGARLMAIVAEGRRGRVYLAPTLLMESVADAADPKWSPDGEIPKRMTGGNCTPYGLTAWGDLFTSRQLVALTTFSDLVQEARERVKRDALAAGVPDDNVPLNDGGTLATAYADAVTTYLAFAVSKAADRNTSLCFWEHAMDRLRGTFGRQALPMIWDFAETNPFAGAGGDIYGAAHSLCEVLEKLPLVGTGDSEQADATAQSISAGKVVSTDPPYYDNIGYADLSDFFYVWLRRSLRTSFVDLFGTVAVPKAEELVATPYRHGSKDKAEVFFLGGMTQAMERLATQAHVGFPVSIYYAFKQSETKTSEGTSSTGWETFLDAVICAGFGISGTWPMRTEQVVGLKGKINALASSVVLVCRPRDPSALSGTRREFLTALKSELPMALVELQRGNIAPVDLAQAAIGPGMAVYTRYSQVLDAEGKPIGVREALVLINQVLDETLAAQDGDFDVDSRWALTWFEQSGFSEGEYGVAETLATARNTSVSGLVEAGIVSSSKGKVRLLKSSELQADWDPTKDGSLTAWESVHHLVRVFGAGGEAAAAALIAKLGAHAEIARELCYRLYTMCERKKRASEAMEYNALVQSWPEIVRLSKAEVPPIPTSGDLFA